MNAGTAAERGHPADGSARQRTEAGAGAQVAGVDERVDRLAGLQERLDHAQAAPGEAGMTEQRHRHQAGTAGRRAPGRVRTGPPRRRSGPVSR